MLRVATLSYDCSLSKLGRSGPRTDTRRFLTKVLISHLLRGASFFANGHDLAEARIMCGTQFMVRHLRINVLNVVSALLSHGLFTVFALRFISAWRVITTGLPASLIASTVRTVMLRSYFWVTFRRGIPLELVSSFLLVERVQNFFFELSVIVFFAD